MKKNNARINFKRALILVAVLLVVMTFVLLWRPWNRYGHVGYQPVPFRFNNEPHLVLIRESAGYMTISTLRLADISENLGRFYLCADTGQGEISVGPVLEKEEFGSAVYRFDINDRGVRLPEIVDFTYAGEPRITVARGRDWFLQIIR